MIAFIDFVPEVKQEARLFRAATMESLQSSLERANKWIVENNIQVLNVETVLMPNIHNRHEEGSQDTNLATPGELYSHWYQFIRVWYRA